MRPVPLFERQQHERDRARVEKDTAFKQRYIAGDPDAIKEMRRIHVGLSMQVGTQEQIEVWERAHAGRKPA